MWFSRQVKILFLHDYDISLQRIFHYGQIVKSKHDTF
nr:MAG TPA: hypothetical protein [Caudoviricetes sp.]